MPVPLDLIHASTLRPLVLIYASALRSVSALALYTSGASVVSLEGSIRVAEVLESEALLVAAAI